MEMNQHQTERFEVGAYFQVIDPLEEGRLFRVDGYQPMNDRARAIWGVTDEVAVLAVELEKRQYKNEPPAWYGTKFRCFPVSLMVPEGSRRSNRSAGISKSSGEAKNPRECECGCGEMTKGGRFRPGHDARYHAAQRKAAMAK